MQTESQRIIEKILNSDLRDQSSLDDLLHSNQCVQMVIQLDSQKSATIKIHPQDDPQLLAKSFCFQYSIDPRVIKNLSNSIKNVKNMEFHQNHQISNHNNSNHNNSKISVIDKQNNLSLMNHSINSSFNKENTSAKNITMIKNDTTLMTNDFSRQSVFDRLYRDSRKKKNFRNCIDDSNKKEKKVSSSFLQNSQTTADPCLIIYEKNTKAHQSALLKRQEQSQENLKKSIDQCTFKPQINSISQIIAKKLPQSYRSERHRQKDIKRIQKFLLEKQQKELAQCTFEPKTLQKNRSRSAERYKMLYQDSKIRELNRKKSLQELEKLRQNSTVKINKISQSIVGSKTFTQRLKENEQRRFENKIKIQYEIKEQNNRKPSTGRGPTSRPHNISIGEHLYNQARQKSIEKQNRTLSIAHKLTCKKSEQIYENIKKIAFQYIFALLDSNEDGLISHTKVQLNRLPREVLKLLAPLLIQMEEMKAELNETEFLEALERLFNTYSVVGKQTILNIFKFKNKNVKQNLSFKPTLNEKSMLWANENRPQKTNLYELWKQTEAQKQERLQQIRACKVLSQLQQCTFHPLVFR